MDYSVYDLMDEFKLGDVAVACTLREDGKKCDGYKADLLVDALAKAIQSGELTPTPQAKDYIANPGSASDGTKYDINWRSPRITISRNELKKWFASKSQKPAFLYPEVRATDEPVDKPLDTRERTTLLQIVAVLAKEAGQDLTKPYKAADCLLAAGAKHGIELPKKPDTIAAKLKEAQDLLKPQ